MSGIVDQIMKFRKAIYHMLGISFAPKQLEDKLGVSSMLMLDVPLNGLVGKAINFI